MRVCMCVEDAILEENTEHKSILHLCTKKLQQQQKQSDRSAIGHIFLLLLFVRNGLLFQLFLVLIKYNELVV